ncbi:hypothetical protein EsH8_X_000053 [Colletotrichum jinshuiense]
MSSSEDLRFVHEVFAVCEDQHGRPPSFIDQPFKFDAMYKSASSILFRLSVSITDSTSKTIIYLQITPDRIALLRNTTCDTSDTSNRSPPCLEQVRQRLGGSRFVTRLQLQLHSGIHTQLVVPTGFTIDTAAGSPSRRTFDSATSLANASMFSLYIPHNVLPMMKFRAFTEAVRQFPTLTAAQRQAYERMVDLRRLYHGKGGIVFIPEDQNGGPLSDRDHKRSTTPATTESYATTVPFDTPPRYQDSPPRYDECLSKGQQSKARSNAAAISVESPGGDCTLPEYDDTEWRHGVLKATKRVLHCGSEDVDLHPTSKRKHSCAIGCTTTASTKNIQRPERVSRSRLADADCSDSRLEFLLERQRQQIERLQEDIEGLQRRNKELEAQHDELEENCCDLEHRQVNTEETIESLLIHTGELDDECEKLGKQVPDICDEMEDWMKDNMGDRMKEYIGNWLEENMAETINAYINDQVAAQIAQVKTKMRKALQD